MHHGFLCAALAAALLTAPGARASLPGVAEAADLKLGEARYLLDTGQLDQALDAANAAIHLDPQQPAYFMLLGRIQLVRGKSAEAQLAFSEAARLDPANGQAAALSSSLVRKVGIRAYAEGVDAFNHHQWRAASRLLKQALDLGNLPPEHSAIAQQDLIIAQFSLSRVQDEIRHIQDARATSSRDFLARRITPQDVESYPATNGAGNALSFVGRIVEVRDDALFVAQQQSGYNFRDPASSEGLYAVLAPGHLPADPRLARGATVRVTGHVVEPPSGAYGAFAPRVTVMADSLEASDERQGRGLAGPLRLDFLRFNDEQRANLAP